MAEPTALNNIERVPPNSLEGEMAVLGAVLIDNAALSVVTEYLVAEAFYKRAHRDIFAAMASLSEKGEAIDIITLAEELKLQGTYQTAGGPSYLTHIMDSVHTAANAEYYARLVFGKFLMRKLITIASDVTTQCLGGDREAREVLDDAERQIFELSERGVRRTFQPISRIIHERFGDLERMAERAAGVSGLATPYADLDSLMSGLQNSELIILAARPSMGKTSLALNLAEHIAIKDKVPVGIFSLEMSAEQLVLRLLCSAAGISSHRLRRGFVKSSEFADFTLVAGHLSEAPVFIDDAPGITMMELRAKARRLKAEVNVGCIIVDYLQLITVTERAENRTQEISVISRGLKALAKELDIPVVALSQLSRAVEGRTDKRPQLSDLREGGTIEQDADTVIMLYRADFYEGDQAEEPGVAELIIAKQRNGPTGKVKLTFLSDITRFVPYSPLTE